MIDNIKIITGNEIKKILKNKENEIVNLVREAYELHHNGQSELPHSIFLKFKEQPKDRIIGLPAYLGGNKNIAGFKWISSFPNNITNGIDRASALLVLNSMQNGRPTVMLESSIISAKRTAASAALAAKYLYTGKVLSIIGCGFIGYEILRFTLSQISTINEILIYDLSENRAKSFQKKAELEFNIKITIVNSINEIFSRESIIALATTVSKPYIDKDININSKSIILNISLRDISAEIIANSINIVDDFEHVNRFETSIHLATKLYKNNKFYYGTISDLINKKIKGLDIRDKPIIFSPFGLGVLDIILANYCLIEADKISIGTTINSFFPTAWNEENNNK